MYAKNLQDFRQLYHLNINIIIQNNVNEDENANFLTKINYESHE